MTIVYTALYKKDRMKRELYAVGGALFGFMMLLFLQRVHTNSSAHAMPKGAYVSFDQSMEIDRYAHIKKREDFAYVYNFLKNIYEQQSFNVHSPSSQLRIPKIIHVMWLGGKLPT